MHRCCLLEILAIFSIHYRNAPVIRRFEICLIFHIRSINITLLCFDVILFDCIQYFAIPSYSITVKHFFCSAYEIEYFFVEDEYDRCQYEVHVKN